MKEVILDFFIDVSLEAQKAQDEARVNDAVQYHMRRMQAYKDWVKPEAIEERKAALKRDEALAKKRGEAMKEKAKKDREEILKTRIPPDENTERLPKDIKLTPLSLPMVTAEERILDLHAKQRMPFR